MESALYGIFTLVGFVSEISLVRCAHSFDFRYFTNSCENPVRTHFPWSNLYISNIFSILFFLPFLMTILLDSACQRLDMVEAHGYSIGP